MVQYRSSMVDPVNKDYPLNKTSVEQYDNIYSVNK